MISLKSLQHAPPSSSPKHSYLVIMGVFFLYSVSFTLVVPTLPKLLESLCNQDTAETSRQYGIITSMKYFLEFLSAPSLGAVSDTTGRRLILAISLSSIVFELTMISLLPSLLSIYLATMVRGVFDQTQTMIYAIAADIAAANDEPVTKSYGFLGGIFGLGCIVGPIGGSLLAAHSVPLCFQVAALTASAALCLTLAAVKETLSLPSRESTSAFPYILPPQHQQQHQHQHQHQHSTAYGSLSPLSERAYSPTLALYATPAQQTLLQRANPFTNLRLFFSHPELCRLSLPYLLSHFCTGIYFIWILYMTTEFGASVIQVGTFLSVAGCVLGLYQGILVPMLVPGTISDETAVKTGLCVSCMQMAIYGVAPSLSVFYVAMLLPASIYGPSLKSLFVKAAAAASSSTDGGLGEVPPLAMGALQGALSSLRTVTAGCGSLAFTAVFSASLENERQWHGIPFLMASGCYLVGTAYSWRILGPSSAESGNKLSAASSSSGNHTGGGRGAFSAADDSGKITMQIVTPSRVGSLPPPLPLLLPLGLDLQDDQPSDGSVAPLMGKEVGAYSSSGPQGHALSWLSAAGLWSVAGLGLPLGKDLRTLSDDGTEQTSLLPRTGGPTSVGGGGGGMAFAGRVGSRQRYSSGNLQRNSSGLHDGGGPSPRPDRSLL